jgi:large conductance mechanosensitive channel
VSKEKESVMAGFKAFLMRGNVVDLAVAVVIGAAFTNIVNAVVKGVINPVVGAFGTPDLAK